MPILFIWMHRYSKRSIDSRLLNIVMGNGSISEMIISSSAITFDQVRSLIAIYAWSPQIRSGRVDRFVLYQQFLKFQATGHGWGMVIF